MLDFKTAINTRVAPSPTGPPHIGLVRTAYLNYLAARSTGGKFILRIDDTDPVRSKKEFEDNILETFEWLGLDYDDIYHQSKRYDRYRTLAEEIIGGGWAVRGEDGAVFLSPQEFLTEWADIIAGTLPINTKEHEIIENMVILRADGSPTYHWASCIDDMDMGIDLIIRGTDHIGNSPKHLHIFDALGVARPPKFAHVGLIFHNKKKISKRDGISNMETYKSGGYSPDAILNTVLKLGWSHPDAALDKKMPLINKESALGVFKEGHLKSAPSSLDLNKLEWLNKRYAK